MTGESLRKSLRMKMRNVLITGKGSYVGTSVGEWLERDGRYKVTYLDMVGDEWRNFDFSGFDSVYHVAGIAHADISNVSEETKRMYYAVNCDLAVETAMKARDAGVRQFIYMSSLLVYGDRGSSSVKEKMIIDKDTKPQPTNFYGDSKWQAELKLRTLDTEEFHVAILRPPMIYGKGCKGNYPVLAKIALKVPVFPDFPNERSILYIGNLAEFVRLLIDNGEGGVFFPQNAETVSTADLVKAIAKVHGKKIRVTRALNWAVYLAGRLPGKIGVLTNKAFGSLVNTYHEPDSFIIDNFEKSIKESEA